MSPNEIQQFKELLLASNQSLIKSLKEHEFPSKDTTIFMEKQTLINTGIENELVALKAIVATKQDVIMAVSDGFKEFKKDCDGCYATKENVSFNRRVIWWIIGVVIVVGAGAIAFVWDLLRAKIS